MVIRQLTLDEMGAAALVHRAAFDDTYPWLKGLHTPDEDRQFYSSVVFVECEVWGKFSGEELVAIIGFREGWIDQLYVLPNFQGAGVGRELLERAKGESRGLQLWTFQKNLKAIRFYERNGFVEAVCTDGSGNEEKEPDMLLEWKRVGDSF